MTRSALEAYQVTLEAQLGEQSPSTLLAILDRAGDNETELYGWLEDHTYNGNKDSANVTQKRDGIRFICASVPTTIDVYDNLTLYFLDLDREYTVECVDRDKHGVQVLWLR